jgi:hypothetical protein
MIRQIRIPPLNLPGVLYSSDGKLRTVLVFFSGFATAKQEVSYMYANIAKRLQGVDCVLFDYYGFADSPGDIHEVTVETLIRDAKAVIDFIRASYPTFKFYLVGKGLSVNILKLIIQIYEVDGLINFDGLDSITYPYSLSNGEVNYIDFRSLMHRENLEECLKVKQWLESIGADEMDLLTEKLNLNFLNQLVNLESHHYPFKLSKRILWFISTPTEESCENKGIEWMLIEKGSNTVPFRAPEQIVTITNKIQEWLSN